MPPGPRFGVLIDLPLIGDPRPSLREVVQLSKTINRDAGLALFGQINLALSVAAVGDQLNGTRVAAAKLQEKLVRTTISQARLNQIRARLGAASFETHAIFHRRTTLAAIKLLALFGNTTGGSPLASRDDLDAVVELCLSINSLGDPAEPQNLSAGELAAQLAPGRELDNLPRLDHSLVRSRRMLGQFLRGRLHAPGASELERLFVFLSGGFSFEAYQEMMFGLFAYFQARPLDDLGIFQRAAGLNPYGPDSVVSGPVLEAFLRSMAIHPSRVPGTIAPIISERDLLLDFTAFRQHPVWRFGPDLYLCLDLGLIAEKLASGFYWSVNATLDTAKRRYDFSSLWGGLFEDHVKDVLRYSVRGQGRLLESPFYEEPLEEAFDAVVIEGNHAVVFEIKGLFARASAKYAGSFTPFFRGLSQKFGNQRGAAVQQLARNIRFTFGIPRKRRVPTIPTGDIRFVWPVVVVQEPILGLGLASRLLVERFEHRTRDLVPQLGRWIRPPVFVQIQDLEVVAQHLRDGDFGLVDCLREKTTRDRDHTHSFHDFFWGQYLPGLGIAFKRNEALAAEWSHFERSALGRFRSGEYRDAVVSELGAVFRRGACSRESTAR